MKRATKPSGLLVLVLAAGVISVACSDDEIAAVHNPPEQLDGPATLENRVSRTNEFAFDLFSQIRTSEDNIVLSPHSIVTCFGMAYAGARGNTERQIADVLRFNYPQGGFHAVLKQLNDILESRSSVLLNIDNGVWGQNGMVYIDPYLDTLSACYDADMDYLDFAGAPEAARQVINQWVSQRTFGLIPELFPPGSFDASTYLVLANTVYFVAEWLHQFNAAYTWGGSFTRLDSSTVTVSYMNGEETMPYYEGNGYRAMEMPYKGEQASMVLILPDEDLYDAFESSFTETVLDSVVDHLVDEHITFMIPKFGFHSGFDLDSTLQVLGVTDAFTPGVADFSGMDGTADGTPWIDQVVHKAYIMINEWGTMAFAGTGMEMTVGVHDSFQATRPFIFVIRDMPTGTILFMGRVLDPTAH